MDEVNKATPSSLHPPDDEDSLIQELIGQYLAHEGYVETTKAFADDIADQQRSLTNGPDTLTAEESEDDLHAINRQSAFDPPNSYLVSAYNH